MDAVVGTGVSTEVGTVADGTVALDVGTCLVANEVRQIRCLDTLESAEVGTDHFGTPVADATARGGAEHTAYEERWDIDHTAYEERWDIDAIVLFLLLSHHFAPFRLYLCPCLYLHLFVYQNECHVGHQYL